MIIITDYSHHYHNNYPNHPIEFVLTANMAFSQLLGWLQEYVEIIVIIFNIIVIIIMIQNNDDHDDHNQ